MKFKTELHCHTGDVSNCGQENAEYIVSRYIEAGYTSLVVANHMSYYTFVGSRNKYPAFLEKTGKVDSWQSKVDFFMMGYENLLKAANGKLNIILGMEFRDFNPKVENDYLVFGVTEEWLRASEKITQMHIKEMSEYVHESGMLIYQAHPFRNSMSIIKPEYLDGIEVFNGHIFHNSRNQVASLWADIHGLKRTSGTDFHEKRHICCGGILTDTPIETTEQLLDTLKNESYELMIDYELSP